MKPNFARTIPVTFLELGHDKRNDAHCLACGFEMVGGRYVGLCPKCGSDRWHRTRLKQYPTNGIGATGAQLQGRCRDTASQQNAEVSDQRGAGSLH